MEPCRQLFENPNTLCLLDLSFILYPFKLDKSFTNNSIFIKVHFAVKPVLTGDIRNKKHCPSEGPKDFYKLCKVCLQKDCPQRGSVAPCGMEVSRAAQYLTVVLPRPVVLSTKDLKS